MELKFVMEKSMDPLTTPQQLQALLQIAFKEHQIGNLQEALNKYLHIISIYPEQPDALHLAGVVYMQTNNHEQAIDHIKKATKLAPQNTDAWNNLGISYFGAKKFKLAVKSYKKCLSLNKEHFQALNNLGNAYRELKDTNRAINTYRFALKISPNYPDAHNNIANAFKDIGNIKSAIKHYKEAIKLKPDFVDANKNLALAHAEIGDQGAAIIYYKKALQLAPQDTEILYLCSNAHLKLNNIPEALDYINKAIEVNDASYHYYNTKGVILGHLKRYEEAIITYKQGLKLSPNNELIMNNLGVAYKENHEYQNAENTFCKALEVNPTNYSTINSLGVVQRIRGKTKLAIENLLKSIGLYNSNSRSTADDCPPPPSLAHLFNNLGLAYIDAKEFSKALDAFKRSISEDSSFIEALLNQAIIYLTEGVLSKGWEYYEYRLQIKSRIKDYSGTLDELPYWDNSAKSNQSPIIILPEQGIGDEVMFASIIPDLIKAHCGEITLACDNRLVDIFQRSFPQIKVSKLNGLQVTTDYKKIYLGSLAQYFRNNEDEFNNKTSYLFPLADKKNYFLQKYASTSGLKIGISWKSGNTTEGNIRSIPLEQFVPILKAPNCNFINLQYGETNEEIKYVNKQNGVNIISDSEIDPLTDLESYIAIISNLDLIITIDNSTAHFGGALGIPTWVLLPYSSEWRWMTKRDDSIWYDSIKLYRKRTQGNWEPVLLDIAAKLKQIHNQLDHFTKI